MHMDIFNDDAFSFSSLTAAINQKPHVPGLLGRLGIFEEQPIATTTVSIERMDGVIRLIEPTARGGPGETQSNEKRNLLALSVPHYQQDGAIIADEVQNMRAFGSETEVQTVQGWLDQKTARDERFLDATLEHQRIGAVKGQVTTRDGNTLVDLFTTFGVSQPQQVDFLLGTATTNIRSKCTEVIEMIEDALDIDIMSAPDIEVHAIADPSFYSKLVEHSNVRETFLNWEAAAQLRQGIFRNPFEYGEVYWHRYKTGRKMRQSKNKSGADIGKFLDAGEVQFFVKGVPDLFQTYFAPADYNETVGTLGLPKYKRVWERDDNKGWRYQVQSNPLSICTRPETLVPGRTSN